LQAAYDKWLRAKHAAKKRHEELSAKRKKLKESLENRENQHLQGVVDEREAARRMQKEVCSLVYCSSLPPQTSQCTFLMPLPFSPCPTSRLSVYERRDT